MQRITKNILLDYLCDHLKRSALQLGQDFYIQKLGIPQGSVLSSLLCSFYYGELERSIIMPYLEKTCKQPDGSSSMPNHLLLRLRGGVSDYSCFINGMMIQADDTRYSDIHISSTITVQQHCRPVYHLKCKMCDYMWPKCHPIFYDSNINSPPAIVRLNAYQAFLLCATKFCCYVCCMADTKLDPNVLLKIIVKTFSYMHGLINKRIHDMELSNISPVFRQKKAETIWLGHNTYIRVLTKKQSRHKELLALLKS